MSTNATTTRPLHDPKPLLSVGTRIASAAAVVALVGAAWIAAGHASHTALLASSAALSRTVAHVTLPSVEVIGHRDISDDGSGSPHVAHVPGPVALNASRGCGREGTL